MQAKAWWSSFLCLLCGGLIFLSNPADAEDALSSEVQSVDDLVATEDWVPPDLSSADEDQPELLVLKVAQEEIGYVEGPLKDQSKYGEWFGEKQAAWCAEFITWCVDQADQRWSLGLLREVYPYNDGPKTGSPWYIEKGRFVSDSGKTILRQKQFYVSTGQAVQDDTYLPQAGDCMWFNYYVRGETDHIALVEGVSRDRDGTVQIHVIEGNNPDAVARNTYPITLWSIYGYGTPVKRVQTCLRLYNRGDDVVALKSVLSSLQYYTGEEGNADQFTPQLQKALKALQKEQGLTVNGVLDGETWMYLKSINALEPFFGT